MNTETDTARLDDMIEVLNDGKDSNEDASLEVKRAGFKRMFDRVARTKRASARNPRTAIGDSPV
jgi:hypothetical protein